MKKRVKVNGTIVQIQICLSTKRNGEIVSNFKKILRIYHAMLLIKNTSLMIIKRLTIT